MAVRPGPETVYAINVTKPVNQEQESPDDVYKDKQAYTSDKSFVPPNVVADQALELDQSSQSIKTWLLSFQDFKPGTSVSLRFRLEEGFHPVDPPYSLLPVLTKLLRSWFDLSLVESQTQDRQNMVWLLKFTLDYVQLGHWRLNHEELLDTCQVLLHICANTRQQSQFEGSLAIFEAIAETGDFPAECLQETLGTLCTAIVILENPSVRIRNCMRLLASGTSSEDTITFLERQLLIASETQGLRSKERPSHDDFAKSLISARGAARHLAILLDVVGESEKFVIDLAQLLDILKQSADAFLLRLATEILDLCTEILRSQRANEIVLNQALLPPLIEIYDLCEKAYIITDVGESSNSKQSTPREDVLKRERRYQKDHSTSLSALRNEFVSILPVMENPYADDVWMRIRNNPGMCEQLPKMAATFREPFVQYAERKEICIPGKNEEWKEEMDYILDKIVINSTDKTDAQLEGHVMEPGVFQTNRTPSLQEGEDLRVRQRIRMLRLCARGIAATASPSSTSEQVLQAGYDALKKLIEGLFSHEKNIEVRHALLEELVKLCCDCSTDPTTYPFAELIINALRDDIVTHAPSDNTTDGTYFTGTETIRKIFLRALPQPVATANLAYQALLSISSLQCKSRRSRLAAMSVLFRIRADTSGTVYVQDTAESAYLASAVCKTDESLGIMFAEAMDDPSAKPTSAARFQDVIHRQLWMYPRESGYVASWQTPEKSVTRTKTPSNNVSDQALQMSDWLYRITTNLQEDKEWETYSYIIVHLSNQLKNVKLFEGCHQLIVVLRSFLCGRVRDSAKMFEPPQDIGLKKPDVALCFYDILTHLIPYSKMQPTHSESGPVGNDLVRAFRAGISNMYEGTARGCIHALSLCCFETPAAIASEYPAIVDELSKQFSKPYLLVHILEFLAQVARLPQLHAHFNKTEIRQIYGICVNALKTLGFRNESEAQVDTHPPPRSTTPARQSGVLKKYTPYRAAMLKEKGTPGYSAALAYHTMIFWFLSIPIADRRSYVNEITNLLIWQDANGQAKIAEQTKVFIDMMQRSAFSDLPETARDESFTDDPNVISTSYIDGNSLITIETNNVTGLSQFTKRQASGTTHAIFQPLIQERPEHFDLTFLQQRDSDDRVLPSHTFLNMIGSSIPIPLTEQPLKLNPSETYVRTAINIIDRIPTVDSHGIGVILAKDGQTNQNEYLANSSGTVSFNDFLSSLGTKVSLQQPCKFETHQMQYEIDGEQTIAWRDRINEIVYKISTFMPTVEADQYQTQKMGLIGNSNVIIVFNQSNQQWKMSSFQSGAVSVHIVITPANRASEKEASDDIDHEFYQLEVLTKEEYHNISAAADSKVVSKATLGPLVRMLALNADIFAATVRSLANGQTEFPSSWRNRFQQIVQLKERAQRRVLDTEDSLARRYDFSRYT